MNSKYLISSEQNIHIKKVGTSIIFYKGYEKLLIYKLIGDVLTVASGDNYIE